MLAAVAEMPPEVVTVTLTVPDPIGAVAVICVFELTTKLDAGAPPKLTEVAPAKLVPVMVTALPPAVGPAVGLSAVTVGAAR